MNVMQRYIAGSFMIVVSIVFLIASLMLKNQDITDPAGGSFFPALISAIMLICGLVSLNEGRKSSSPPSEETKKVEKDNEDEEGDEDLLTKETWDKNDYFFILKFLVLVILYVVLMPYLSFVVSTLLFLVVAMIFLRGVTLIKNILISISTVAVIYVLFKVLFQIVFP